MIRRIEGTNWTINDGIVLYENQDAPGHFLTEENKECILENRGQLFNALKDVGMVFKECFKFDEIRDRRIEIVRCKNTPVALRGINQIGLNRTDDSYNQDVYQFAHELMHFVLDNIIPNKYMGLEESLCMLSSILMPECLELLDIYRNENAIGIKEYTNMAIRELLDVTADERFDIAEIFKVLVNNEESVYTHNFKKELIFAKVMQHFIGKNFSVLELLRYLPTEEGTTGFMYLIKWVDRIPSEKHDKIIIENFVNAICHGE